MNTISGAQTSKDNLPLAEVYNLASDHELIRKIQKATLTTTDYGLVPEHGLFGSPEWWEAVRNGTIRTVCVEGIISRLHMTSMNDWPEFEINSGEKKTSWTRMGKLPGAYVVGKRVCLDYVIQKAKKDLGNMGLEDQVVLRIAIEP